MIKKYSEFINELVITNHKNKLSRQIDTILDQPSSNKSLSSSILLRKKLRNEEDLITYGIPVGLKKSLRNPYKKYKKKLDISINNINYLKSKLKEKGELRCEYCNFGPLIIYDTFFDREENENQFIKHTHFRSKDGATCDHKNPIFKGGDKFSIDNLAVCCSKCNTKKGSMEYEKWIEYIKTDDFKSLRSNTNIDIYTNKTNRKSRILPYEKYNNFQRILYRIKSNKIFTIESSSEDKFIQFKIVKEYYHLDTDKIIKLIVRNQAKIEKLGDKEYKIVFKEKLTESFRVDERMVNLSPIIEDLMGIKEEEISDIILELNDTYSISTSPCCFEYDAAQEGISSDKNGICDYDLHPNCDVINIGNNKTTIKPTSLNSYVWGYLLEFWPKNAITYAKDRICDYLSIYRIYININKSRLDHLGLDIEIVKLSEYSNNIGGALYAIAIYKKFDGKFGETTWFPS